MEIKLKPYRYQIILFISSAILLLSHLGKIDVNIMEARNFISAREMIQNKEYLLTTLNNEPRYQKPPLPTWLTAISGKIAGFDSIFFLRLPVAIITLILVFFYFHLCRLMGMTDESSLIYSLILITSFYIFFSGRDNQWDMYTHSFMFGCIFFLWKLFNDVGNKLRNSILSGIFFGFSVLSKGPISFYTLFLPFLIAYGIVFKIPFKKWPYYLLVVITGIIIGLSWYVYVRVSDTESFRSIVGKETSNWNSYGVKPFYYYWSFFLQSGLWALPSLTALIYPYLIKRVQNRKAYKFAFLWTITSLVLMSLVPEKKIRYLVPVLIPLALTTGFYIEYLINQVKNSISRKDHIIAWVVFGIFPLICLVYPIALPVVLKENLNEYLFLYIFSSGIMLILAVLIIKGLINSSFKLVFSSLIIMFTTIVITGIPISDVFINNPEYIPASKAASVAKDEGIKIYRLSDIAPELVWDFGGPIPLLNADDNKILLPCDETSFGLLAAEADSQILRTHFINYMLVQEFHINMYPSAKHNKRLEKDFYIVTRKE